jgi:hypothetical protein
MAMTVIATSSQRGALVSGRVHEEVMTQISQW